MSKKCTDLENVPGVPQEIVLSTSSATVPYRASLVSGATTGVMHSIATGLSSLTSFSFVPTGSYVDIEIADNRAFGGSTGMESIQVYYFQIDTVNYTPQTVVTTITSGDDYHYGYNGQMKTNEWAGLGNHLDFGARGYDPRIARFNSLDPMAKKHPYISPYCSFDNNPIALSDPDGRDATYSIKGNVITVSSVIRVVGATEVQRKQIESQITQKWGGNHEFKDKEGKKYSIRFEVKVISEPSVFSAVTNKTAMSTDNIAFISGDVKYRDNVALGKIISFANGTEAASHEYGHTLGLADQYFDVYTYKNGYGAGKTVDDYILSAENYIGVEDDDLMGKAGERGVVSQKSIEGVGNYILNNAKKTGKSTGKIEIRDAHINEVDNKTKIESGYQPPPVAVDPNVKN